MITTINWNDTTVFKTWNYKYLKGNISQIIIDAIAVLIGNYPIYRKQAAFLLLKALVRESFLKSLLDNKSLYPYDRNDYRVKKVDKRSIITRILRNMWK